MGSPPSFSSFEGGWWGGPAVVSPALRFPPRTDPGSQCWPAGQLQLPGGEGQGAALGLLGQNFFSEPSPPLGMLCVCLRADGLGGEWDAGGAGPLSFLLAFSCWSLAVGTEVGQASPAESRYRGPPRGAAVWSAVPGGWGWGEREDGAWPVGLLCSRWVGRERGWSRGWEVGVKPRLWCLGKSHQPSSRGLAETQGRASTRSEAAQEALALGLLLG